MRIFFVFLAFIGILASPFESGAKGKKGMKEEISFPNETAGWRWDGKKTRYNFRTLFDYINGAAELYLAYGFQNLDVRRLEKPGQPPIIVEVYEMESPEDAYGVFSFERQDEEVGIGQGSELGGGLLRFWKGKYFIAIYAEGEGAGVEPAIINCAKIVSQSIYRTAPEPKLIQYLPPGFIEKSICYLKNHVLLNQRFFVAHKNILHLDRRTEAVLAQYMRHKQKIHLLLIRYPSPREAEEAFKSFVNIYMPEAAGKGRVKTEDRKWTMARQQKEYVLIVFGSPDEVYGEELLQAIGRKLKKE